MGMRLDVIVREEQRLGAFENSVVRRIFGSKIDERDERLEKIEY
jgi:hypothetical protein